MLHSLLKDAEGSRCWACLEFAGLQIGLGPGFWTTFLITGFRLMSLEWLDYGLYGHKSLQEKPTSQFASTGLPCVPSYTFLRVCFVDNDSFREIHANVVQHLLNTLYIRRPSQQQRTFPAAAYLASGTSQQSHLHCVLATYAAPSTL